MERTRLLDSALGGGHAEPLTLAVPDALTERIAERAAAIVLERLAGTSAAASPFLTVAEAAEYLRCSRQRVYDLLSSGRLPRFKDGSRVLVSRAELDAHLAAGSSRRVATPLPPHGKPLENSGAGRRLQT